MRKFSKKAICLILSLFIIFSNSLTAFAVSENEIEDKIDEITTYFNSLPVPEIGSIGGDWIVTGLARADKISQSFAYGYLNNVVEVLNNNGSPKIHPRRSTENSRVIIALTSIGENPANVCGYNLIEPLADFKYVTRQGINGAVWALIAVDTKQYEIPTVSGVSTQTTRQLLIDYILDRQMSDGGWSLSQDISDVDITAMAVTSLAPYYNKNDKVKSAIDMAVIMLSDSQNTDGGFGSWDTENVESCAQVITALTSLGINPKKDSRFIKNGKTVFEALMKFSVKNGFSHIVGEEYNQMSTEQTYYALTAYRRLISGKTSLFDMTDLIKHIDPPSDINGDGRVSILDSTAIQKYLVSLTEFTDEQIEKADCDKNGRVNILDATYIQKYLVKL